MAAVALAFVCIDTLAYLSMPSEQTSQARSDFISWVNTHLKGDTSQPYQYEGRDVYAARCSVLHVFGSREENRTGRTITIRKFGYHDGGLHAFDPSVSSNLVIIGVASFLNDVVIAVGSFIAECKVDISLRRRVEGRLATLLQVFPFSQGIGCP